MQQQQSLQTLRRLNQGKDLEVEHQLSGEIETQPINKQEKQLLGGKHDHKQHDHDHQHSHQHDHQQSGHDHGHSYGHSHGGKSCKRSHGGKAGKNYCIMFYTIFTCLSCLYLQTQHLNPYRGDHTSQVLTYFSWFDVLMCLWCYIQTYRIGNKVNKLSKIMNVDMVQNKVIDAKYLLTAKHCQKCNFHKFPRVSHCSTCGQCIYKLDHHCMWTQTCIGHCNQRPFYLFCVYMCIGVLQFWYSTYRAVTVMTGGCNSSFFGHFQPGVYILWALTCLSAGVVGMMILGLTVSHTLMIMTNCTTLDTMKTKRMCALPIIEYRPSYFDEKNINPFDRGQIQNLKSLFGTNILTFWMPFGRQIQNEFIIQPMNPQPSKLQLMRYTNLFENEQKIQRQVERMIPQLKTIYQGKTFIIDGKQITL